MAPEKVTLPNFSMALFIGISVTSFLMVQVFSEELSPGDRVIVQGTRKKAAEKPFRGLRF